MHDRRRVRYKPAMASLLSVPMVLVGGTLFLGALVPNLFVLAPRYLASAGYDAQQIGVVMGGFNVCALLVQPLAGWLIERFGHRRVLIIGCLVAGAGSAVFEAAGSLPGYTGARALQGAGFAAVLVAAAAYVAEIAPPGRLAQALGISGVLTLASQACGPALGELLEQQAGWSWVFRAGAAGGLGGALVALALAPAARPEGPPASGRVSAWPILVATGLAGFGFGAVWSFLADYAARVDIPRVTWFFAPYVASAISTRLFLGHLADTAGRRAVAVPALLGHAAALAAMAALGSTWHLIAVGLLFGLSHGLYYPTLQAMIVERGGEERSRAIAASTFSFGLGIALGAFGLGVVAKVAGYPPIYLIASGAGIAAAVVVWLRS
jgi:MFS family permease